MIKKDFENKTNRLKNIKKKRKKFLIQTKIIQIYNISIKLEISKNLIQT